MLKLAMLITLFICFVYSNNERDVETQLPPNDLQLPAVQGEEKKNTFHTIKGNYIEEKKSSKPCKEKNKSRRLNYNKNTDGEWSPQVATTDQINTATVGKKLVTASVHGANYNYRNENGDTEIHTTEHQSENCDCGDCVLEENKKVLQFESMEVDSNGNPFNDAAIYTKTEKSGEAVESDNTPINAVPLTSNIDESVLGDRNNEPINSVPVNSNTGEFSRPCKKGQNMNTRRKNCGRVDLSENKFTTTYRRILPGLIENPTNKELEDYKLYQDNPQPDQNDEEESRQIYFPNVQKVSNTYGIDLVHNMNINEVPEKETPAADSIETQLIEPTKGKGIYDMKDAGVMLLENSRVCYACSTISDPSCWAPSRKTTVKYCRKGHQSCLTKSFKHKGKSVIIRDCGSYCVNQLIAQGPDYYSSCSICHSDVCNGASPINIYNTAIVTIVFFGIIFSSY